MSPAHGRVTVVGSLNIDRSLFVTGLPTPGATVHARSQSIGAGGKGANQAVAAARMGATVELVGAVGDDEAGTMLIGAARHAGVGTDGVQTISGTPTGSATITVADDGENMIVVLPGANGKLTLEDVPQPVIDTDVLLLQLETPIATQLAAARVTRGTVILNPAPMPAPAELADLLECVDVLVPNRSEAAALTRCSQGMTTRDLLLATQQVATQRRSIVVTLGADGAAILTPEDITMVPGIVVAAVDSTGAGDTFCGTIAASMATGVPLLGAVRTAVQAAAITVTRPGAQGSFPTAQELAAIEPDSVSADSV